MRASRAALAGKRGGVFRLRKRQAKSCQFRNWARKGLIATFFLMSWRGVELK
jgi:hypothetical protein